MVRMVTREAVLRRKILQEGGNPQCQIIQSSGKETPGNIFTGFINSNKEVICKGSFTRAEEGKATLWWV